MNFLCLVFMQLNSVMHVNAANKTSVTTSGYMILKSEENLCQENLIPLSLFFLICLVEKVLF